MKKILYSTLLFLFYTTGVLFIATSIEQIQLTHSFIIGNIILITIILLITRKENLPNLKIHLNLRNVFIAFGIASFIFIFLLSILSPILQYGIIKKDISSVILYILIAPICEELFFRHILSSIIRNEASFILCSTILFIIFHIPTHWSAILAPLALSLVNGWVYLKNRDIVQIVLIHSFINLFVVLLI